jgi:RNA polymerase sigma-70 factor (ECF subfamily)
VRQTGSGDATTADLRRALRDNAAPLLAYFERRVTPAGEAPDLLAETMLQAWRRASAFPVDDPDHQRAWLYTVAAHVMSNHRRSNRRRRNLSERLRQHLQVNASPSPTDRVDAVADAVAVRDAVQRLSTAHRDIVTFVHWDGLSLAEAATVLGINASTARSRYATARENLRASLTDASNTAPQSRGTLAT